MRSWHCVLLTALTGPAVADPGYYVVSPYDQAGRLGAELRYWTVKPRVDSAVLWPELGVSWGVNSRWTTRLLASGEGESWGGIQLSTWNWINDLLLTQGDQPYDLALHAQLVHDHGEHTNALELGPAWQTDLGRWRLNANAFWEYDSGRRDTRLKLQWRAVGRLAPGWRLGAEGFSEVGRWNDWLPQARQSHRAGPALLATLWDTGPDTVTLNAAYLFGKTYGQRGDMFTMQLQWLR